MVTVLCHLLIILLNLYLHIIIAGDGIIMGIKISLPMSWTTMMTSFLHHLHTNMVSHQHLICYYLIVISMINSHFFGMHHLQIREKEFLRNTYHTVQKILIYNVDVCQSGIYQHIDMVILCPHQGLSTTQRLIGIFNISLYQGNEKYQEKAISLLC